MPISTIKARQGANDSAYVRSLGGEALPGVTAKLHYLVIGVEGNLCRAFACYGRNVEKAVALRRNGVRVVILHENDFHDTVLDGV